MYGYFDFPGIKSDKCCRTKDLASVILSFSSFSLFAVNSRIKANTIPNLSPRNPTKITMSFLLGLERCSGIPGGQAHFNIQLDVAPPRESHLF